MTGPAPGAGGPDSPMAAAPTKAPGPSDSRAAATSTGPPGTASGPPAGFASVLNSHVARTALAEGQKKSGADPSGHRGDQDQHGTDPGASAQDAASLMLAVQASLAAALPADGTSGATAATAGQSAATDPATAGGQPPTLPLPTTAAPADPAAQLAQAVADATAQTATVDAQPARTAGADSTPSDKGSAPATPSDPTAASVAAPVANPTGTAPTAAATDTPTTATSSDPTSAAAQTPAPPVAHSATPTPQHAPAGDTTPAQAAVSPIADQGQAQSDPQSGHEAAPAPTQATPPQNRAGDAGPPSTAAVEQPSATSTAIAQPPTQTTVTTPSAGPAAATTGVDMTHAIETVRMTVAMAARQGYSQARIQLSPASLGGINIQLRQTQEGLVARVIADHPEAARTLQEGGAELRRSLESAGISLLRLDIGASEERGLAHERSQFGGETPRQRREAEQQAESTNETTASQPLTVQLGNGTAVNVLA